jgi:hypothetical protein
MNITYNLYAGVYPRVYLPVLLPVVGRSTPVENVRQITSFYAKQTQFQKCKMNISTILAMRYENLGTLMGGKTKPKQTQLKPIQTQFKANKAKNKPNSNPICRKGKNERFCVDKELYDSFGDFPADSTTLKGANFKSKMFVDLVDLREAIGKMVKVYSREAILER